MIISGIDWTLTWNTVLAISTSIMAIAIVAGACLAVLQLVHIRKSRYSSLLMQLHQTWDSKEYIKSLDADDAVEFYEIVRLANFFENLGYLVCDDFPPENSYIMT